MNKLLLLLACALANICYAQKPNVTVTAKIKDLEAGQWVYLRESGGSSFKDSVQTTAGGFVIKTNIPAGDGNIYSLRIGKEQRPDFATMCYLEKGTMNISGDGPLFKTITFSGSKYAQDFNDLLETVRSSPLLSGADATYEKAEALYKAKDTAALAKLRPELERIDSVRNDLRKQWVGKHPSSPISAMVIKLNLAYELSDEEKEKMMAGLTPAAKNNQAARDMLQLIEAGKATGEGRVAPDFTQNDTLGKPVSLKDFRGKYVLIDFWASWCGPCRHENPNVVSNFNKFKDKGFTVLGISLDQPNGKEKWLKAIHDDQLTWTHVSDLQAWNNAVAKQYGIRGIPANLLLDPEGKIIGKDLRGEDLEKKLAAVLVK